ncbi:hypothetical protein [Pseudoxanthomonas daejeonensis]|uniref:Uncharacterized protein n=1 Tax=Pseudoxanthomonas daejeonensis TaxID=266062 RepID=A0ABQ6Z3U2_9GAMM|nr:hypothetical protein [Pseudoxanthomonas daejeonensis]KAF1691962.1 hypothetical protein CSC65_15650 [Pseudoxanthomonas daejeonensis]
MKNLVSLSFSAEDLAALDAALLVIEQKLGGLVSLTTAEVRGLAKMGEKSEVFCRSVLQVLQQNPQVVTPALGLPEANDDLAALDALRPRLRRLKLLTTRGEDTLLALGADVMSAALEGYALLKVSGRASGLEDQRRELGSRFARAGRKEDEDEEAVEPV